MEWITAVRKAIEYMEANLKEDITVQDVAGQVYMSPLHFQRGFLVMTGCSVSEYLRNRRLYLAAQELCLGTERIIDIALRHGYDTPESFTKAFTRFHGVTPVQVRQGACVRSFLPLNIRIIVQGGNHMAYKITRMFGFKVIGFAKQFNFDTSYAEIPKFWDEICEKYGVKNVGITLRRSLSASDNAWSAMFFDGKEAFFSREYMIHIVNRVGGGDSFTAGLIYSLVNAKPCRLILI